MVMNEIKALTVSSRVGPSLVVFNHTVWNSLQHFINNGKSMLLWYVWLFSLDIEVSIIIHKRILNFWQFFNNICLLFFMLAGIYIEVHPLLHVFMSIIIWMPSVKIIIKIIRLGVTLFLQYWIARNITLKTLLLMHRQR